MQIIEIKPKHQNLIELDSLTENDDVLIIGNKGGRLNLNVNLDKPNTKINIYGIIVGHGNQQYNITTSSNHNTNSANSRIHLKAIMFDKSRLDFEGMIKIKNGAQLSDAYLQNDNLIIGELAKVNSSPQLEIEADDVSASHGVTITTISETEKFYLKSRGLSNQDSERIIIRGFINDFINKIKVKEQKKKYQRLLHLS